MSKEYKDQLGEWVRRGNASRHNRFVSSFLAVKDDIQAAIDSGFSARTVWKNLSELKQIEFSYDTFLLYQKRFIPKKPSDWPAHPKVPAEPPQKSISPARPTPPTTITAKTMPEATGFTFNPIPNKEDLI